MSRLFFIIILTFRTPLKRYCLESVFNSKGQLAELSDQHSTKLNSWAFAENSFNVSQEEDFVLFIENNGEGLKNQIVLENILTHKITRFPRVHSSNISNLILLEHYNTCFSAGFDGVVVQYNITTGDVIQNYGDLGIYDINAASYVNNIVAFGGQSEFKFIHALRKEIVHTNYLRADSIYVYTISFFPQSDRLILFSGGDSSKVTMFTLGNLFSNSMRYVSWGNSFNSDQKRKNLSLVF